MIVTRQTLFDIDGTDWLERLISELSKQNNYGNIRKWKFSTYLKQY